MVLLSRARAIPSSSPQLSPIGGSAGRDEMKMVSITGCGSKAARRG